MVCCENQGVMTESHAVLGISTSHNHLFLVVFCFIKVLFILFAHPRSQFPLHPPPQDGDY